MQSPERAQSTLEIYHQASKLDPLKLDETFNVLASINQTGDTTALQYALNESVAHVLVSELDTANSLAALRDIDFLASSYVRHGENPIEDIAGLEEVMVQLGNKVGTVPRGTVATYALANPEGDRERNFTGDPEESLFIDAVRKTSFALEESLQDFVNLDASSALDGFEAGLDTAIQSIVSVMRALPPEYFTDEMRPYFDPLVIQGKRYLGAGGAQLQFVAFDYVLWGAADTDEMYNRYFEENYAYLTPSQQLAMQQILTKYEQGTMLQHIANTGDKNAALSAYDALKKMKKFRYPHRKLAQENFKVRKQGQVGSGDYTPDILDLLLEKTESAIAMTESIIQQ